MVTEEYYTNRTKTFNELEELKNNLKMVEINSERDLIYIWHSINHMRSELNIPKQTPLCDVITLFNHLEEIRKVFDLQNTNFGSLNELHIEITTIRNMLECRESTPLHEFLVQINPNQLSALGLSKDSLLKKLLHFYKSK